MNISNFKEKINSPLKDIEYKKNSDENHVNSKNPIILDSDSSDEEKDQKVCLLKEYETINKIFEDILKINFEDSSRKVEESLQKFEQTFQINSDKKQEITLKKDPKAQK